MARRMAKLIFLNLVSTLTAILPLFGPANACSNTTPCKLEGGEYYVGLPEPSETLTPAIIYIHGYGGSPEGALKNERIMQPLLDRGYAIIAPQGLSFPGSKISGWSFHPNFPKRRDEIAFLKAVRDAAVNTHGLDPTRIILTGFSIGGSMTSYLACAEPESFAAYAPVGGSFWRAHPEGCTGPVRLLHTHGWKDGTVPLEGRVVRGQNIYDPEALVQGDVFHAMEIWRETNGCVHSKADRYVTEGLFWRRAWDRCDPDTALEFALFPGGHIVPAGWADMMLDWFEGL